MCSKGRVRRRAGGAKPDQKSEVSPCPLRFVATDPGPAGRFLPENTNLLELQPLGQGLALLSALRSPLPTGPAAAEPGPGRAVNKIWTELGEEGSFQGRNKFQDKFTCCRTGSQALELQDRIPNPGAAPPKALVIPPFPCPLDSSHTHSTFYLLLKAT